MRLVGPVVDTQDLLPPVEREIQLVGGVVGGRGVVVLRGPGDHRVECRRNRPAVGGDAVLRNDVAGERLTCQRIPEGDRPCGKVPTQLGQRRQGPALRRLLTVEGLELHAAKEEEPVAEDRPAKRRAIIVEVQLGLDGVPVGIARREVVRRIQRLVPEGLEHAAAEAVGSTLGDDVDGRAGVAPLVGREIGRLDRYLLDEVDADVVDHAPVRPGVEVEAAVHRQVVAVPAVPVDYRAASPQPGGDGHLVIVQLNGAGNERGQLQVVPSRQRERTDLRPVDDAGDFT